MAYVTREEFDVLASLINIPSSELVLMTGHDILKNLVSSAKVNLHV